MQNKKTIIILELLIISIGFFGFSKNVDAAVTASINASRVSCVAPCGVYFEGTGSLDNNGDSVDNSSLHDNEIVDYSWDFGTGTESDISSGGRYFNGFNAAHVFEIAGAYTVKLSITDSSGNVDVEQVNIITSDFSGETYCFSNDGDFSDCPVGGINVTTSLWTDGPEASDDVLDFASPNRRLLLKRGDIFSFSNTRSIGEGTLIVSSFGEGTKPLVDYVGSWRNRWEAFAISGAGSNVSVIDISFDLVNGESYVEGLGYGGRNHLLLLRSDFNNILQLNSSVPMFVVDSSLSNDYGNPMYLSGDKAVIVKNNFGPSTSHGIYGECSNKAIFFANYFHDVSTTGRTGIRIAGNTCFSNNILITDNRFENIPAEAVQIEVTTHTNDRYIDNNVLIKNNYFKNCSGILITRDHGHKNISVANNVFNLDEFGGVGSQGLNINGLVAYNEEWARGVDSLWVYNNTFHNRHNYHIIRIGQFDIKDFRFFNNIVYGDADYGWVNAVGVTSSSSIPELSFDYNLYYMPNRDEGIFEIEGVRSNFSWWQSQGFDSHGLVADPGFTTFQEPYEFSIDAMNPAYNKGTVAPTLNDFAGVLRPKGGSWDIGAYEYLDATSIIRSDVDDNSETNTTDALLTLRNSLGLDMNDTAWVSSATAGDVDCNGVSNSTDALLTLRYSLGLEMDVTNWCE